MKNNKVNKKKEKEEKYIFKLIPINQNTVKREFIGKKSQYFKHLKLDKTINLPNHEKKEGTRIQNVTRRK